MASGESLVLLVDGVRHELGGARIFEMLSDEARDVAHDEIARQEAAGRTVLVLVREGIPIAVMGLADALIRGCPSLTLLATSRSAGYDRARGSRASGTIKHVPSGRHGNNRFSSSAARKFRDLLAAPALRPPLGTAFDELIQDWNE